MILDQKLEKILKGASLEMKAKDYISEAFANVMFGIVPKAKTEDDAVMGIFTSIGYLIEEDIRNEKIGFLEAIEICKIIGSISCGELKDE